LFGSGFGHDASTWNRGTGGSPWARAASETGNSTAAAMAAPNSIDLMVSSQSMGRFGLGL
jgi:hypothetical protein